MIKILISSLIFFFFNLSLHAQPNILLIISDDQRYDQMKFMPKIKQRIFNQGVSYKNAYITTSACCPSRASIFTGLYSKNHAVLGNNYSLTVPTVFQAMSSTYYNGLIGKYLNTSNGQPKPEFDYWDSYAGGNTDYKRPIMNRNGTWIQHNNHIINVMRDSAIDFLNQANAQSKPFFLTVAINAPHRPSIPRVEERGTLNNLAFRLPKNFNDSSRSASWVRNLKRPHVGLTKRSMQMKAETLLGFDKGLDAILDHVQILNKMADTIIIYLSDNGIHFGEKGLMEKDTPYEESVRVPFAIRWDNGILNKRVSGQLVSNIDIAPTISNLTNVPLLATTDGIDITNSLWNNYKTRTHLYHQGLGKVIRRKPYYAVRTNNLLLIKWLGVKNNYEFFNYKKDRLLMNNLYNTGYERLSQRKLIRKLRHYINN